MKKKLAEKIKNIILKIKNINYLKIIINKKTTIINSIKIFNKKKNIFIIKKRILLLKRRKIRELINDINNILSKKTITLKIRKRDINYKNFVTLIRYIDSNYRILPSRINKNISRKQNILKYHIKYARYLGLLPYTPLHKI